MAGEVSKPHDHLFRTVFGEKAEAAGLLRAHLPETVSRELLWSSLRWQSVSFIDDRLRDSESDLLYAIERKGGGAPAWLYVLLEHRSTPDAWLRLRLLKYSIRIWERDRRRHPNEEHLRPIVPLVFYQGERRWRHACEFSELFSAACDSGRECRATRLLIDQTGVGPDDRGELRGRIAQLAMMAAYAGRCCTAGGAVAGGRDRDLREIVVYIATTTPDPERWHRFAEAVRREVPGGGELMGKTEKMLEIYAERKEQEARQEGELRGELRGKVLTIEGFLGRDVPWSIIEAATGVDQATFGRLKKQLQAADDDTGHRN